MAKQQGKTEPKADSDDLGDGYYAPRYSPDEIRELYFLSQSKVVDFFSSTTMTAIAAQLAKKVGAATEDSLAASDEEQGDRG